MTRQQNWQSRKLAEGKCRQCGRRPRVNKSHCERCRKRHNLLVDKRRALALESSIGPA